MKAIVAEHLLNGYPDVSHYRPKPLFTLAVKEKTKMEIPAKKRVGDLHFVNDYYTGQKIKI